MSNFITPVVGMGCTINIGSDSYAATVIKVETTRQPGYDVTVQDDISTPAEGHDYYGTQKYTYTPNPEGQIRTFRFEHKKAGSGWREIYYREATDRWVYVSDSTYRLNLGERETYSDPSF